MYRFHEASLSLTNSVHQVRKLSVGLAMNKDHLEEAYDTSDEETAQERPRQQQPLQHAQPPVTNPMSPGPSPMRLKPTQSGRMDASSMMQSVDRPPSSQPNRTPPTRNKLPTSQSAFFSAPTDGSGGGGVPKKPGVLGRSISMNNLTGSGGIRSFRKSVAKATGMRGAVSGKKTSSFEEGATDDGAGSTRSLPTSPAPMNLSSSLQAESEEVVLNVTVKGNRLGVALTNARDDGCLFVDM